MTVIDRGFSVQEVEALSHSLEVDLENVFKAMLAQALNEIMHASSPQEALTNVERLFSNSTTLDMTDDRDTEPRIDA